MSTAVVIGAGHNGLVAALRLARAGRRVVVLEALDRIGGLAGLEEIHPGFRAPALLDDTAGFRPAVARALGLERHGLRWAAPEPVCVAAPGNGFLLHREPGALERALAGTAAGAADVQGYRRWRAYLGRVASAVRGILDRQPPPLRPESLAATWSLARQGLRLRRLGRRDLTELLRVTPMPAADWLREEMAFEPLVEALAIPAVLGTFLGPHSAGSSANLLFAEASRGHAVSGGAPALVRALGEAVREAGVSVETGRAVEGVEVVNGRVTGVETNAGRLAADLVVASCHPAQLLLELVPPNVLPLGTAEELENARCRGTVARLQVALSAPLEPAGWVGDAGPPARIRCGGGSMDALERAFDAVKYRQLPDRPVLEVAQAPSAAEDGQPSDGGNRWVASVTAGFVPRDLDGGWTPEARRTLEERILAVLGERFPTLGERVVATALATPEDLERRYRLPGGCPHHVEHALDQLLFMRPTPTLARYATPIAGLYLAGSGSHPGGGLTGVPGWLGAGAALRGAGS